MEHEIVLFCNFGDSTAVAKVCDGFGYLDLFGFICNRWTRLNAENLSLFYSFPGHPKCMLDNEDDFNTMITLLGPSGLNRADIYVREDSDALDDSGGSEMVYDSDSSLMLMEGRKLSRVDDGSKEVSLLPQFNRHKKPYLVIDSWVNEISQVGQVFMDGIEGFRRALVRYSICIGFNFEYANNDKKRVTVFCSLKTSTSCSWRVHASLEKSNGFVYIRTLNNVHECGALLRTSTNSRISSDLICTEVLDIVRLKPDYRPKDLIPHFKKFYGLDITYDHAWMGIEKARKELFGDHSLSFNQLLSYFDEALLTNPGSHYVLDVYPDTSRFRRSFVAFHACKQGFKFCRPMLFLDGTFLKGRYKGNLLAATAKDGAQGLFPVAFAIVGSEDEDNWTWFLEKLVEVVDADRTITFISDRHPGLLKAREKFFPMSYHSFCLHHLKNNLKTKLGGCSPKHRARIVYLFRESAYAPTIQEFEIKFKMLLDEGGEKVNTFINDIPLDRWTNAHFKGNRYGEMCSNAAESFNAQIMKARHLPITKCIDTIRLILMTQMAKRKIQVQKWKGTLTYPMEERLQGEVNVCKTWMVSQSTEYLYEVHSLPSACVDISKRTCSCRQWQINGFPCVHAVVTLLRSKKGMYEYVEPYFLTSYYEMTYSTPIYPIPTINMSESSASEEVMVLPPITKKQPGRPKKKRIPSHTEKNKLIKCGRCKKYGHHNRQTCKEILS